MTRQNVLLGIIILAILGSAFFWYQYYQTLPAIEEEVISAELNQNLFNLRRLKDLELDLSVLKDPLFVSFKDVSPPKVPSVTTPGRENPFLPF